MVSAVGKVVRRACERAKADFRERILIDACVERFRRRFLSCYFV